MQEKALTAYCRNVDVIGLQSDDELMTERRIDDGSTMSHLAQAHRPTAGGRPSLLQGGEHRARRSGRRRRRLRQIGPPGSRRGPVVARRRRGLRGGRPSEVVGDDGDTLAGSGRDQPRTPAAAVGVEGGQVAGPGGQRPEPELVGAGATGVADRRQHRRRRLSSLRTAVVISVIRRPSSTQSSHYNRKWANLITLRASAVECNHGRVVNIHVPLSPSSIIWY